MNEDSLYNRLAKGILSDEEIDNLVNEIMNIPVEKNNNCLSSYGSINVDGLIDSIKELRKIPSFDNLLKENKKLKEQLKQKEDIINKAKEYIENNPLYDIDVYEYSICLNGIDDEQTRKELLEILDNKGEQI